MNILNLSFLFFYIFPSVPVVSATIQIAKFAIFQFGLAWNFKSKSLLQFVFTLLCAYSLVGWAIINVESGIIQRYLKLISYFFYVYFLAHNRNLTTLQMKRLSLIAMWFHIAMQFAQLIFPGLIKLYGAVNLINLNREIGIGVNHHDAGMMVPMLLFPFLKNFSLQVSVFWLLVALFSAIFSGSKAGLLLLALMWFSVYLIRAGYIAIFFLCIFSYLCFEVYYDVLNCVGAKDFCNGVSSLLLYARDGTTNYGSIAHRLEDWRQLIILLSEGDLNLIIWGLGEKRFLNGIGGEMIEVGIVSYVVNYGLLGTIFLISLFLIYAKGGYAKLLIVIIIIFEFIINLTQNTLLFVSIVWSLELMRRQRNLIVNGG